MPTSAPLSRETSLRSWRVGGLGVVVWVVAGGGGGGGWRGDGGGGGVVGRASGRLGRLGGGEPAEGLAGAWGGVGAVALFTQPPLALLAFPAPAGPTPPCPPPCPHPPRRPRAGDFWARAAAPVTELLSRNNLTAADIGAFELLGGTSRVPRVKQALSAALGGRALDM